MPSVIISRVIGRPAGGRLVAAIGLAALIATALALLACDAAFAQQGVGDQLGENAQTHLVDLAKKALLGIAAIMAVFFVVKRDIAGGVTFIVLTVVLGGFAFAGAEMQ